MSKVDKSREMLVNSMVKTKADAGVPETPVKEKKAASAAKAKPVTRKKAAKKKTSRRSAPARKAVPGKPAARSRLDSDPYQSRGRIWPD